MAKFNVTFNADFPDQAKAAFQYAVNIWETLIQSPVTIEIQANWQSFPNPRELGKATPTQFFQDVPNEPVPHTGYPVALANSLAGVDLNPSQADIVANFNSDRTDWYFETDGKTPNGKYDFVSLALHELAHGLAQSQSFAVDSNGQGSWGQDTKVPKIYDYFIENGDSQRLVSDFPNPSVDLGNQLTSDNIFFNAPQANNANGGWPKLYAPSSWQEGSSTFHLDEATYNGTINALMTPVVEPGEAFHQPGPVVLGMFQDMGWAVNKEGWIYGAPGQDSLIGTSVAQNIYGLPGDDILKGFAGDDTLNGGLGNDFLYGGSDSDVLYGKLGDDLLSSEEGMDTLIGGMGNDRLVGGPGADKLAGSPGQDRFFFKDKTHGKDTIIDFSVVDDAIRVSEAGFGGGLTVGAPITAVQFGLGEAAADASDRFIYSKTTGDLSFDADGKGGIEQIQFAQLSTGLAMTNNDIFVVA